MNTAPYIDIKRFAVHDGPGIRTTLFLKGCSLRCIWCHNPESRELKPELAFREMKCALCGECAKVCKCHGIENGRHVFKREECKGCGRCEQACLFGALELYGKQISVEEAASVLLEDRNFYGEDGGITISGGEPLMHSIFCAELFARMKEEGIHTACDTCGNVPWSAFEEVLPCCDMFLYDFKCADAEQHRRLTGAGNELILENLERLSYTGKKIEIRMVMVPQHNMDVENIKAAGACLAKLDNITAVRLLAYHSMARSKFKAVGHKDTMPAVPPPTELEMAQVEKELASFGLKVINPLRN
ncbi:MAG: glycyl-radical enzyme activating protein [Victivallales bacterium]|nr:glycyl-radical enzyme activating protein [Victivallales bacterium]